MPHRGVVVENAYGFKLWGHGIRTGYQSKCLIPAFTIFRGLGLLYLRTMRQRRDASLLRQPQQLRHVHISASLGEPQTRRWGSWAQNAWLATMNELVLAVRAKGKSFHYWVLLIVLENTFSHSPSLMPAATVHAVAALGHGVQSGG